MGRKRKDWFQIKKIKIGFNITTTLLICFLGCNSPTKEDGNKKNNYAISYSLYKDINPYTLTGVEEIKDTSDYPYIKIGDDKDNKKRIVYMITPVDSSVRFYKENKFAGTKNGEYFSSWFTEYSSKTGVDLWEIVELLYPNFIVEFTYKRPAKKDAYLFKATIIEEDTLTTYFTDNDLSFCPNPNIAFIDNIKNKAQVVITEKMEKAGNQFRITVSNFNKRTNKTTHGDMRCFEGIKHSWSWFKYFIPQAIPCK